MYAGYIYIRRLFIVSFVFDTMETTQMIINRLDKSVVYLYDFTAMKMNELQLHAVTWMSLGNMLSK